MVPDIESWDKKIVSPQQDVPDDKLLDFILDNSNNSKFENMLHKCDQWLYVYHPVQIPSIEKLFGHVDDDQTIKTRPDFLLLTSERKKIKKIERAKAREEKEERVLNGLEKPEENRVRLKNIMKVMMDKGIAEPTALMEIVKNKTQERLDEQIKHNQEHKLTSEQKKEKIVNKLIEDGQNQMYCVIYKLVDLSHPLFRSRITMFAKDNLATGCLIFHPLMNLVVFESGRKSLQKFKKLMNRIKWSEPPPVRSEVTPKHGIEQIPPVTDRQNECKFVWEGPIIKSNFKGFIYETALMESKARKFLQDHQVPHFWDMAKYLE